MLKVKQTYAIFKLCTYYISISGVPKIITDSAPCSTIAHLHATFELSSTSHKTDTTVSTQTRTCVEYCRNYTKGKRAYVIIYKLSTSTLHFHQQVIPQKSSLTVPETMSLLMNFHTVFVYRMIIVLHHHCSKLLVAWST